MEGCSCGSIRRMECLEGSSLASFDSCTCTDFWTSSLPAVEYLPSRRIQMRRRFLIDITSATCYLKALVLLSAPISQSNLFLQRFFQALHCLGEGDSSNRYVVSLTWLVLTFMAICGSCVGRSRVIELKQSFLLLF